MNWRARSANSSTIRRRAIAVPFPHTGVARADGPALSQVPALTVEEFFALRERTDLFESVATVSLSEGDLTGGDNMEAVAVR